jgi:hypothetical protein
MGLEGVIVVDTPDVLLVVHKDSVRKLGELLDRNPTCRGTRSCSEWPGTRATVVRGR